MAKGQTRSKALRSNERRTIKDWPESERPREKLLQLGPEGLSDGELLAVLLRIGALGQSAEVLARQLMAQFNGINGIDRAHVEELLAVPGMAEALIEDEIVPTKYLAPFCLILLGPVENDADDYAESLIFHTINSTALPLESEHGLRLLLGQDPAYAMTPDNEFAYSPELHLTRLLCERLGKLPEPARQRFGVRPLTSLWETARNLIQMDPAVAESREDLIDFSDNLFAALSDILTRLTARQPSLPPVSG